MKIVGLTMDGLQVEGGMIVLWVWKDKGDFSVLQKGDFCNWYDVFVYVVSMFM